MKTLEADNNDIKHYSAEDISRYWQGKMSSQEMHALEAAAMDDPFLADALEGYSTTDPQTIAADVIELRERLKEKGEGSRVVPLRQRNRWWRIAAALILLLGATALTYKLFIETGQKNAVSQVDKTAKQESRQENAAPALPLQDDSITAGLGSTNALHVYDSAAKNWKAPSNPQNISEQQQALKEKEGLNATAYSLGVSKDTFIAPETKSIDLSAYRKNDSLAEVDARLKRLNDNSRKDTLYIAANDANRNVDRNLQGRVPGVQAQSPNNRANNQIINRDDGDRYTLNNFGARVVDRSNNAIPYASVRVNNNNQVAATNGEGYFQIRSPDSVIDVLISGVGYESKVLTLRSNDALQNVVLDPSSKNLKEVTVSGATNKKMSKSSPAASTPAPKDLKVYVVDAQPVDGWDDYNKYLDKNKRVDTADKSIHGEVIVSFTVGKKGQLSAFYIEKSLGKSQDAEAIRLVKEGPPWTLLKGRKSRARVTVTF